MANTRIKPKARILAMPANKVLLIFANPVLHPYAQPYGLTIVKGALAKRGIDSVIALPFQSHAPYETLKKLLQQHEPLLVGIGFRNLDPAGLEVSEQLYTFIQILKKTVRVVKTERPQAMVALGGGGFSIDPLMILRQAKADVGFLGNSEQGFAEFASRLKDIHEPESDRLAQLAAGIRSCIYISKGVLYSAGSPVMKNTRPVALLGRSDFQEELDRILCDQSLDFAKCAGATVPIRTKTGCSLRCSYCVVPFIEHLRLKPIPTILTDLKTFVQAGLGDRLFIADGEFNLPEAGRALELCAAIANSFSRGELQWRCYACPSALPLELATAMKNAGCIGVGVSVDSLSDPVRSLMQKRCSTQVAISSVLNLVNVEIPTSFTMLFGAPGESESSIRQSCENARFLIESGAHISITVGLRVYPNTPLASQCSRPQYNPFTRAWDRAGRPTVFCSPWPRAEVAELIRRCLAGLEVDRIHWTSPVFGSPESKFKSQVAYAHTEYFLENLDEATRRQSLLDRSVEAELLKARIAKAQGKEAEVVAILKKIIEENEA